MNNFLIVFKTSRKLSVLVTRNHDFLLRINLDTIQKSVLVLDDCSIYPMILLRFAGQIKMPLDEQLEL